MFIFGNIIKRFCHHHSRHIQGVTKLSNPLVECEKCIISKNKCSFDNDTTTKGMTLYVDDKLVYIRQKLSPITIHYINNNKLFTIKLDLST